MTNREKLAAAGYEDTVVFSNPDYDNALIGVSVDGRAVYDYYAMVQHLVTEDGMTESEAEEFIDYNTFGSLLSIDEFLPFVIIPLDSLMGLHKNERGG